MIPTPTIFRKTIPRLILVCFLGLVFFTSSGSLVPVQVQGAPPLMGIVADDSTAIQIYRQIDANNWRWYPQDDRTIPTEEFYIWLDVRDNRSRNVTLSLYNPEIVLTQEYDNRTGQWISRNVTEWTDLVSRKNFTISSGDNVYNDPRYGEVLVSTSNWPALEPTDLNQRLRIQYRDIDFDLWHRTDWSLVPITQTRGDQNALILVNGLFLFGASVMALYVARRFYTRGGTSWPRINLSMLALLVTYFFLSWFFLVFFDLRSMSESLRVMATVNPFVVNATFALFLFFWTPGQFSRNDAGEWDLVSLQVPRVRAKEILDKIRRKEMNNNDQTQLIEDLKCDRITLYTYYDENGRLQYIRDPYSIMGLLRRLVFGPMAFDDSKVLRVPQRNGHGGLLIVHSFREQEKRGIAGELRMVIYLGLTVGLVVTALVGWFMTPIVVLGSILCLLGLVVFWAYDQVNIDYHYHLTPLSQDALGAVLDSTVAEELSHDNRYLTESVLALERENQTTYRRAMGDMLLLESEHHYPGALNRLFGGGFKEIWEQKRSEDLQDLESKFDTLQRSGERLRTDQKRRRPTT